MGRDPFLGDAVHLVRPDLHLEGNALVADDRSVQRLVHVRLRHGDEVFDAAGHGSPQSMNDPQGPVAILHAAREDAEGDVVVHLADLDPLPLDLPVDAVEVLAPAVEVAGDSRLLQLGAQRPLDLLDELVGDLALLLHRLHQALVPAGIEELQRQVLELVLDLGHAQAIGDGGIDVERLARNALLLAGRQVLEGAHIVQPVGQLDKDDADIVHHRQHHLAKALGLLLFLRIERDARDLGQPLDHVRDVLAEVFLDRLASRQSVLQHVVQEAGDDAGQIELEIGEDEGDRQRVRQIRLARRSRLALVLLGREDVGLAQEVEVGPLHVGLDFFLDVLEADHGGPSAPSSPAGGVPRRSRGGRAGTRRSPRRIQYSKKREDALKTGARRSGPEDGSRGRQVGRIGAVRP